MNYPEGNIVFRETTMEMKYHCRTLLKYEIEYNMMLFETNDVRNLKRDVRVTFFGRLNIFRFRGCLDTITRINVFIALALLNKEFKFDLGQTFPAAMQRLKIYTKSTRV